MESLSTLMLQLLLDSKEAANLSRQEMTERFEAMADPLAEKVVNLVMAKMTFPEGLNSVQRSQITVQCVAEFKQHFLIHAAHAAELMSRCNSRTGTVQ
jgi:C4-dicarboxylate transporter